MSQTKKRLAIFLLGMGIALSIAWAMPRGAKAAGGDKGLPSPAGRIVDFEADVRPILLNSCAQCHGGGRSKGDFKIDTRATFIKGGETSPVAIPGDSGKSAVIAMVSGVGVDDDKIMPKKGRRLSPDEIGVLRAWIDQGMKWPDGFTFAAKTAALAPRKVTLPAGAVGNPIDVLLEPYYQKNQITGQTLVDDRGFARRVWLDVTGLLPPADELSQFVADTSPDKREKLVWKLLNDNVRYTQHWLSFWNDLLRNDYKGTGYIDGGRKQITLWLYKALMSNMPFDQFVRELLTGANGADGFTKGIVWRGVVNAAQTPAMQASQNISQVFMGVNLKCASCHDSFVSQWKLTDSYGLAGIYAEKPLEMERCSVPTGKVAPMKFLYPELGAIDAKLPRDKRLEQLAGIITSEQNGRLPRTLVNRLWKRFLGRGLVEPVDEMDQDPWDADVLDYLAGDLVAEKWDVKKLMAKILTSKAYQLKVVPLEQNGREKFIFRGPVVKRMTAEQFVDAVSTLSGVWTAKPAFEVPSVRKEPGVAHAKSRWIWNVAGAERSAPPAVVYFRKEILVDEVLSGEAVVTCDNRFVLFVNGAKVGSGDEWSKPVSMDLKPWLKSHSRNVIAFEAENTTDSPNPAGLIIAGKIVHRQAGGSKVIDLASDKSWTWSSKADAGWQTPDFAGPAWRPAIELGDANMGPWNISAKMAEVVSAAIPAARAALCPADPLTTALGRTAREQVTTDRQGDPTTLQALEMSNGETLANMLRKGAAALVAQPGATSESIINAIYERGLGRAPTPGEMSIARELVGVSPQAQGVEDLLWIVAMLPEFQLIR